MSGKKKKAKSEKLDFYVFAENCKSRSVLEHIFSRWNALILARLREGTARFRELRHAIEGISDRVLAQRLRILEEEGLVIRKDFGSNPPHVEYRLSPAGQRIATALMKLIQQIYRELDDQ